MLTKLRNRFAEEEGFTLIELLVVVLIIGILAAVAIPTFLSQKNKANDSNAQSNLKNAQTVVEAYTAGNNGNLPLSSGSTVITSVSGLSQDSDANSLGTGSQNPVYYNLTGTQQSDSYTLTSLGSSNSVAHYWAIVVTNGTTTYGEGSDPGSAIANATSSQTQFPSISTT